LSGGERRRVELFVRISAISSYSKKHENTKILLLLDEPTTGFDMRSEREFFNLIGDEFGKIKNNAILVFSTHALYLLKENIADEIVILEKSKFKKQGSFSELKPTIEGIFGGKL